MIITSKILIIIEIFLIAMIPLFTLGFDYFEKSTMYNTIFQFDNVKYFLARFEVLVTHPSNSDAENQRRVLDRGIDPELISAGWNLIKKHSTEDLPDEVPNLIYTIPVKNTPYIELGKLDIHFIPDQLLVYIAYCEKTMWEENDGLCIKSHNVGTIGDLKEWYLEERKQIIQTKNIFIAVIAVVLGLLLILNRSKSNLLLSGKKK